MKRMTAYVLSFLMTFSTMHGKECCEPCDFSEFQLNSDAVYRTGAGAHEGAATCLGASMLAWGVGLAIVIALIAGLAHQSKAPSS